MKGQLTGCLCNQVLTRIKPTNSTFDVDLACVIQPRTMAKKVISSIEQPINGW